MPNVLTELCTPSLVWVIERRFVVGKSRFKRGLYEPHISLGWPAVFCGHSCLVNHGWSQAISGHWTVSWSSAFACFQLLVVRSFSVRLICCDHRFSARGWACNCSWSWLCTGWRSWGTHDFQHLISTFDLNICSHILAERWVVPDDVLVAFPSCRV